MPAPPEQVATNVAAVSAFCQQRHSETYPYIDPLQADLSAQTVVITGASRGIGRATAFSFVRAGCRRLVITAQAKDVRGATLDVLALALDVTDTASVEAAAKQVADHFGGVVDVLVNNAGFLSATEPLAAGAAADWLQCAEVNLKGLYRVSRFFLPLVLQSATSKTVINVGSQAANYVVPGMSAYQTTKFALCRLTEFMAMEYSDDHGLVAVAVHPGCLRTELASNMPEMYHDLLVDAPELPGDTFVWIAKEKREWLSGRYVEANWDMEELEGKWEDIVKRDVLKFRMTL
ncbi:NAD(P)-binding protein [Apiospora hydei]|uniref:NAD(P)-binding protein n=1 Tax=Apiospora hydei TaxID=1337664 RepID=A0ABR1VTH7_9PEZI